MNKYKLWLTLILHLTAFTLVLMVQIRLQHPELLWTQNEYWAAWRAVLGKSFATPATQLTAAFLILGPLWAVFITRKAPFYGNIVWVLSLAWCVLMVFFFIESIKIQPWLYWFLYAALMLFLGMAGILYRVLFNQEKVEIHMQGD